MVTWRGPIQGPEASGSFTRPLGFCPPAGGQLRTLAHGGEAGRRAPAEQPVQSIRTHLCTRAIPAPVHAACAHRTAPPSVYRVIPHAPTRV